MLKKPFLLFFSLLGAIFILASCGIGKDAVTDTKYKVSLQQAAEVKELGAVNDVLAKAKKEVGGLSPRILTWKLTKNNNKLVYTVDVKTTTADEKVTLDANK